MPAPWHLAAEDTLLLWSPVQWLGGRWLKGMHASHRPCSVTHQGSRDSSNCRQLKFSESTQLHSNERNVFTDGRPEKGSWPPSLKVMKEPFLKGAESVHKNLQLPPGAGPTTWAHVEATPASPCWPP